MSNVLDTLKKADAVQPIAEKDGMKVVSFDDAVLLAQAEIIENEPDVGIRHLNPDGTLARSKVTIAAVNEDSMYDNRFRRMGQKKMIQIVVDKRAIRDQATGKIYTARVPAYQIVRENGRLKEDRILTVSDDEFIGEFVEKAGKKDMVEILPLIDAAETDISVTSIGI